LWSAACTDYLAYGADWNLSEAATSGPPSVVTERRKHTRHQWVQRVLVRLGDGKLYEGTSVEIGRGGISAVLMGVALKVGERVEFEHVMGMNLAAEVRRIHKHLYGFAFLGLSVEQDMVLTEKCHRLPLFRTMLDI